MTNSKEECIKSYDQQGYRILEIPINPDNPKALTIKGWNTEPTNLNVGKDNLYAVVQEDNKLVFDFDDKEFNHILSDYLDKTLVNETGNGGYHYHFKDIKRQRPIKIKKLYKNGKVIGDIKAHMSYVIGCGSSYQEDGKTKTYTQVSSTDIVLEIDCTIILQILKDNGITTTKETGNVNQELRDQFNRGEIPTESQSNDYFFQAAVECRIKKLTKEQALEKIKPIYDKWIKSEHYSNRPWANIEIKIDDAYKKPQSKQEIDIYEIAERLMEEYNFITLEKTEEIVFYKDGVYRENGQNVISKRSRKLVDNIKLNHINEIKGIIKDETGYTSHDEFDKEPYLVNMKNIIFNLKTGKTIQHSPDYLSRVKIPVFYDSKALCPRFDKFLASSLDNDEEKIRTILEMIALCYIKDNSLVQKAFMNTGKGSNGKTILLGIIIALLGKDNTAAKAIHDFESNRFAAGALENKLANICADVGNKGINGTELLKKTISGDPLDCEKKFMNGYTFIPYATLIFSANDIPEVSDESDGFARRFELIEWEIAFYGKDRDHTVKTIQYDPSELSGIFNKISKVAKEILETHELKYESTVQDAKTKWLMRSDSTQRFIDEKIIKKSEYSCSTTRLFSEYNKFCKEHGMTPLNDRKFNSKLEKLGFERVQKKISGVNLKVWLGLNLHDDQNKENTKLTHT